MRARIRSDPVLLAAAVATAGLGLVAVTSAARSGAAGGPAALAGRQAVWVAVGVGVMVIVASVDQSALRRLAPAAYGLILAALVVVLSPLGRTVNGAQAWFDLGPARFQPAEIAKPVLIVVLAAHVARRSAHGPTRLDHGRLLGALVQAGPMVGLVLLQPDLGTAVVLAVIAGAMVVLAGAPARPLAALAALGAVAVVGAFQAGMVAPYQIDRLTSFLNQSGDPGGATWNLEQSKIAIGSGGLTGSGLFSGSQTRLAFVPEQHTDFVFTVVGEEFGLVGGLAVLGLFGVLVWRTGRAAWRSPDAFGAACCSGVLAMFVFQIYQNMGMTMGLMPVTGIPLPFLSYGGSSTVASFAAIGLVANVARRPGARRPRFPRSPKVAPVTRLDWGAT